MTLDFGPALKDAIREALSELRLEIRPSAPVAARPTPPSTALEARLGVEEIVTVCGGHVTAPTIRAWCKSGKLAAKKVGRGYLVERAALERFLSTVQPVKQRERPDPEQEASRILSRVRGHG